MKDSTKRFIIIIAVFVLMLVIPVLAGLLSERSAAQEISSLGGEYSSLLPMQSCGGVSGTDIGND